MRITKYGHACLLIEEGEARVLIDPGVYSQGFEELRDLSAILITHQHQDHVVPAKVKALLVQNAGAGVYADEGSAKLLADEGAAARAVRDGDELTVGGVAVAVVGRQHAEIHASMPRIPNVGYLIAGRFFYPGDNLTRPDGAVEVLAVPAGAPWLKIGEAIDYVLAVRPRVAIPVHDAVLAIPEMNYGLLDRVVGPAGVELRVVPNGQTTEV
jgi:L-ascorbate metabolism protein UlaG (beta-lactamase superfamily)